MLDIKKELPKIGLGIVYVLCFYWLISAIKPNSWELIFILICTSTLFNILFSWDYSGLVRKNLLQLPKTYITIIIIVFLMKFLSNYGMWGYVLSIAITCSYILYSRRKYYFEAKHHIESMIWGKPLNEFVKEGKKPPKLILTK